MIKYSLMYTPSWNVKKKKKEKINNHNSHNYKKGNHLKTKIHFTLYK